MEKEKDEFGYCLGDCPDCSCDVKKEDKKEQPKCTDCGCDKKE